MSKENSTPSRVPTVEKHGPAAQEIFDKSALFDVPHHVRPKSRSPANTSRPSLVVQSPLRRDLRHSFPNRATARLPNVRTPPPDLWTISNVPQQASATSKPTGPRSTSTSVALRGAHRTPPVPHSPPGLMSTRPLAAPPLRPPSLRQPLRPIAQLPISTDHPRSPSLLFLTSDDSEKPTSLEPAVSVSPTASMSVATSMAVPMISPRPLPHPALFDTYKKSPPTFSSKTPTILSTHQSPQPDASQHLSADDSARAAAAAARLAALPPVFPKSFCNVLAENKRRNPHAPVMVSRFNPLREQVPFRAWQIMPIGKRPPADQDEARIVFPLLSAKYRTSVFAIPNRSRDFCDPFIWPFRRAKGVYLRNVVKHCRFCQQDTLLKKHMAFAHFLQNESLRSAPPSLSLPQMDERDSEQDGIHLDATVIEAKSINPQVAKNDDILLESPILRDLDDFEIQPPGYDTSMDADDSISLILGLEQTFVEDEQVVDADNRYLL